MKCYAHGSLDAPRCQQDINHKGHHDDGSPRWSMKVNGARHCYDHPDTEYEYDSQWGAGLFNDWPKGHHKRYGE
jgi:hypothetical protein